MNHTPADVIRYLLISLDLGSLPTDLEDWPIFYGDEPNTPDNCITLYDTPGTDQGRSMIDGALFGFYGFQVRVRAATKSAGYLKALGIQTVMAQSVIRETVTIEGTGYFVHSISNIGDVLDLGKPPQSSRVLFTINAVTSVRQLA